MPLSDIMSEKELRNLSVEDLAAHAKELREKDTTARLEAEYCETLTQMAACESRLKVLAAKLWGAQ